GPALVGAASNRAAAEELGLLAPRSAAAGEYPGRAGAPGYGTDVDRIVTPPADDGGVAVAGEREGLALLGGSDRAAAAQLGLLCELRQRRLRRPKQRSAQQSRTNVLNCSLNWPHLTLPTRRSGYHEPAASVALRRPAYAQRGTHAVTVALQ